MSLDEKQQRGQIAKMYSIVFPGTGLIYMEKWILGIIQAFVHMILLFLISWETIGIMIGMRDDIEKDGTLLIIYLCVIIANWGLSFMLTRNAVAKK